MAHPQKPHFVFRRNGRDLLNRRGRQFSRLLSAEVCASAVIMLDTPCSEIVRRVLATHSIRQFPLHFPSRGSPCAITFQLDSTNSAFARRHSGKPVDSRLLRVYLQSGPPEIDAQVPRARLRCSAFYNGRRTHGDERKKLTSVQANCLTLWPWSWTFTV